MAKNIEIEKMSFAKDMPLPSYSSDNCSGLDLYAANKKNLILKSGKTVIVSSGIKIALKKNFEGQNPADLDSVTLVDKMNGTLTRCGIVGSLLFEGKIVPFFPSKI